MTSQNKELSWLLSEKNLSDAMTAFYNAIIASDENSKLLLTEDPWEINPSQFGGNSIVKEQMSRFCEFLELIQIITKDEEIYKNQFLKPFQMIVKDLIEIRSANNQSRSSDLDGWIFSKSRPTITSSFSKEKKITVSTVFPELQTVMSASVSENSLNEITSKYHQFEKCVPIGLVNRIHQTRSNLKIKENKTVLLSEFNFLFTAFSDIKLIGSSMEMENFCEIDSIQSKVKQHMGFPFVSFAKVISSRGAQIRLQDIENSTISHKFTLSDHYMGNAEGRDPDKLVGKYVRFFGVAWHDSDDINAIDLGTSEIFLMQEEEDLDRLRFEGVLGFIRLRSKITQSEIEARLGQKIEFDKSVEIDDGLVRFKYLKPDNPIFRNFIQTTIAIRNLREKYKTLSPRVTKSQLIHPRKEYEEHLKILVKKHKFKILYSILLNLQNQIDLKGEVKLDLVISKLMLLGFSEGMIHRKLGFLKYLELIEKINDGIKITDLGKKILYGSCKDELKQINFTSQKIIKLEDIEKYNIPTSIFLKYLENTKGFHPLKLDDHKETKIFWKKNAQVNNTNEEIKVEYLNKRNKILDIMRAVSHPITTQSVSEELEKRNEHLGNHIVYCLLLEIKKEGIVIEDGESWKYPIHSRIFDLFQEFSDNSFDIDSVLKKCVIPKSEVEFVEQKLREYEKLMYVTEINGEWISSKGADKKINQIRKQEVREAVLTILNEVHNISKNDIVKDRYTMNTSGNYLGSKLISQVSKIFQNREIRIVCSDQMIKDEIDSMVVDGIITKTDEYYQKKIN